VNAAILAVQILAIHDASLARRLAEHKESLAKSVLEKSEKVQQEFQA
jgi:phosphoribosylcarboxyaminoimidazole (NCAIR) mutase